MSPTYFSPAISLTLRLVRSHNIDPEPLLEKLGIDSKQLTDPNARFDVDKVNKFFWNIADLISDPNFALQAGNYWHPSQLGVLGYAWLTSSSLRTGFNRLIRFTDMLNNELRIELEESDDGVAVSQWFVEKAKVPRFRIDSAMSVLMAMIRSNTDYDFQPESVTFTYAEPEDSSAYHHIFKCPIHFGMKHNAIIISAAEADKPRECSNTQLALLNDQLLIEYMAKLDKNNIVERVKLAVINELGSGHFSDITISESLHMSQRTLQRRLEDNGTTFKILVNEIRQELADKYLNDSSLSLTEISFMLGFSEMSAFSRAFKRWSGRSPSDYRIAS